MLKGFRTYVALGVTALFIVLRSFDMLPEGWTEAGVTDAITLIGLGFAAIFRRIASN